MVLRRRRLQRVSEGAGTTASWSVRPQYLRRITLAGIALMLAASLVAGSSRALVAEEYDPEVAWAEQLLLADHGADVAEPGIGEQQPPDPGVRPAGFLHGPLRRHRGRLRRPCAPPCSARPMPPEEGPSPPAAAPEGATPHAVPPDVSQMPAQPDLGDIAATNDLGLFDSGLGAARAPGSAYTAIVGDVFFGQGQLQFQQAATLVPGTITYTGLLANSFIPTSFSSEFISFSVNEPLNSPTVNQWSVTQPGGPTGTATLEGFDAETGLAVVSVTVPTLIPERKPPVIVDVPSPAGLGRTKIAENNSPFPVDRVFFNYNYYHNALQGPGPFGRRRNIGPNRYLFGLEKTFLDGDGSIEVRAPLASTLNSDQSLDGSGDIVHGEFGNIMLTLKLALWRTERFILAGGLGLTIPTADDVRVFDPSSPTPLVRIRNDAVHLGPYLAVQYRPGRFLWQFWVQTDVDPWGNGVILNLPQQPTQTGRLQDQTMLLISTVFGYAVFRSSTDGAGRLGLTRVTPAIELHQTSSLQSADFITAGDLVLGNFANNFDILNLTIATHFQFFNRGTITPAYVVPLTQKDNRFFDGELGVQANWRY